MLSGSQLEVPLLLQLGYMLAVNLPKTRASNWNKHSAMSTSLISSPPTILKSSPKPSRSVKIIIILEIYLDASGVY